MMANGGRTLSITSSCSCAKLERNESENADAPRAPAEAGPRLFEQILHLRTAEQCEREKGQRAVRGDRLRKRGGVADARHRPLQNRVFGLMIDRQG